MYKWEGGIKPYVETWVNKGWSYSVVMVLYSLCILEICMQKDHPPKNPKDKTK